MGRSTERREVPVRIRFHDESIVDFADLVCSYPKHEFASPRRSTVPLLAFWADAELRFRALATYTGLDPSEPVSFCFEYPVHVQQGEGKASLTDLMIISSSFAVAIEGKYTEPAYETVEEWLSKPDKQNRKKVLAGWLFLIHRATGIDLEAARVAKYPYQLIHRTASACYPQVKRRWIIYQLFSKSVPCYYLEQLSGMQRLLGSQQSLSFGVLLSPPRGSAGYSKLEARWEAGERDLSTDVSTRLLSGGLFEFFDVQFVKAD
jgi:hypothetical protein